MNDQTNIELITKDIQGLAQLLKVTEYKGVKVYLMRFYENLFAYFFAVDNVIEPSKKDIWFAHLVITPEPDSGRNTLTESEVNKAAGLILTGATATIDIYLEGLDKANAEKKNS